jgi:hypothetical protein
MAVCPRCQSGVGINAERCPNCGAALQITPEPQNDPIEQLKDDIEDYVQETAPEDMAEAEQQIANWRPTVGDGPPEIVSTAEGARPVPIFNASDEIAARLTASLLQSEGIDVMVEQHIVPGLDTARQMDEGIWGQVFVHQQDAVRAKEILDAYNSDNDEPLGTEENLPAST